MRREGHIAGGVVVAAMLPISFVVTSTWVLVAVVASRNNAVALEAYLHTLRIFDSWFGTSDVQYEHLAMEKLLCRIQTSARSY